MSFDKAFKLVFDGKTDYRITQPTYDTWNNNHNMVKQSVKNITLEEVKDIYETEYWVPAGCQKLPDKLAAMHFDSAVRNGVAKANKMLQRAVGAKEDGKVGPKTIAAIKALPEDRVISNYRSLMNPNLKAFLDMLAFSEGTSTSPATKCDGYDVIVTGIDGKPEIFTDFSDHPFNKGRKSKVINSKGLKSSASGRYQFMLKHWTHYRDELGLPDFGPDSQDIWAIQLIRERRGLNDIAAGRISSAIVTVKNIWASLPGAGYGQHENDQDKLIAIYVKAGGQLA